MRDPLDPRPDVHDFNACLARSGANVDKARALGSALFEQGEDTAPEALDALERALDALEEARAALRLAAIRRQLEQGFGDVAALEPDALRQALALADVPNLLVHVDRQAQVRVGAGPKSWSVSREMSDAALADLVRELREHLPDFLKHA